MQDSKRDAKAFRFGFFQPILNFEMNCGVMAVGGSGLPSVSVSIMVKKGTLSVLFG